MTFTPRDGQTLYPSPMVEMFDLDLTPIGVSSVYRFFNGAWEGASRPLYFPVHYRYIISKMVPIGTSTIYAGALDSSGTVEGAREESKFQSPSGCASDSDGNVYVADSGNNKILIITAEGVVSTFSGGDEGADDGALGEATFNSPSDVVVAPDGTIYVSDAGNHTIRKIYNGIVSTLAGSPGNAGADDGTGSSARFDGPRQIAFDENGNLYISDTNGTIRKVTPSGVATTLAGTAYQTGSDDGTGANARFNLPYGLVMGPDGALYVADTGNHTIRKVTLLGAVTTIAGSPGVSENLDGVGSSAHFVSVIYMRLGWDGDIYVLDYGPLIRRVTLGGVVTTMPVLEEVYTSTPTENIPLVWKGYEYISYPIEASGFEVKNAGTIPRPKIRISTLGTSVNISNLVLENEDLVGATFTRRRTLRKYLDAVNFDEGNANADPLWERVDIYQIAQKTLESPQQGIIEWELRAAWDMEGKMIPKRIIQSSACTWKTSDTDICEFVATCDRKLATCLTNYPSGSVPYGGFPGSGLASL